MIRDNITKELIKLHDNYWRGNSYLNLEQYEEEIKRLRFKYVIDYDRED